MAQPHSAGPFSLWLEQTIQSLHNIKGAYVPCGSCTACCRSSYFITIRPDDTQTIEHIPGELLFPAPNLPEGSRVLGYDRKGNCPVFKKGRCSIYAYRPLTCRQYDCRVFSATGLDPAVDGKILVSERSKSWHFDFPAKRDREEFSAVQMAAQFLNTFRDRFPRKSFPSNTTQLAVKAVSLYQVFLGFEDFKSINIEKTIHRIMKEYGNQ